MMSAGHNELNRRSYSVPNIALMSSYQICQVDNTEEMLDSAYKSTSESSPASDEIQRLLRFNVSCIHRLVENFYPQIKQALKFGVTNVTELLDITVSYLSSDRLNHLLHLAVLHDQLHMARILITKYGCPVDCQNKYGETPLHIVCSYGYLSIVRMLILECKADMNIRNYNENTPLNKAALNGHVHVVVFFVKELSSSPKIKGYRGRNLLHQVCDWGHTELLEMLISDYNVDPMCVDYYGSTPLHLAALSGRKEVVSLLITKYRCAVDCRNRTDQTPLHCACYKGHLNVVKMLLFEYKADSCARDKANNTPLNIAALNGHVDIIYFLIDKFSCSPCIKGYKGQSILHQACARGHVELAETLITDYSLDPISVDHYLRIPLHLAVLNGRKKVVNMVISFCEHKNYYRDSSGQTPLHYACMTGQLNIVKLFNMCKCKTDLMYAYNYDSDTPLNVAASNGHTSIVIYLIDVFGCNASTRGHRNQTILHQACGGGYAELTEVLVAKYNLDPMSVDDYGDTPLHLAALYGKENAVNYLITKYNCPVDCRNKYGETPLHYACQKGHLIVVEMLVSKDETLLLSANKDGNTPQHISAKFGMYACVCILIKVYRAPIYIRNKSGKSVLDVAKDLVTKQIIKEYQNTDRVLYNYKSVQSLSSRVYNSGGQRLTRVFVVGNVLSGKSTLIEALKREGIFSSLNPVSEATIPLHTSGIIPSVHHSKATGRVLYYDFAGDPEYYSSHSAVMSSIVHSNFGTNIFFVVTNLTKSTESICDELGYWFNFISYLHVRNVTKYKVLVIGSHIDLISDSEAQKQFSDMSKFVQRYSVSDILNGEFEIIDLLMLNCRQPKSTRDVRNALTRIIQGTSPCFLSEKAVILLGLIEKDFKNVISCSLRTLIEHIEETGIYLPNTASSLHPIVLELHSLGFLMSISATNDLECSMLFLDISKLTNEVHQHLFSSSEVPNVSMGILPRKYLKSILPEYINTECLVQLQYCQEFNHTEVKLCMELSQDFTTDPFCFYFPALCTAERKEITFLDLFTYSISWSFKCSSRFKYFPPRFLHVLLLRLAYKFALPVPYDQSFEETAEKLVQRYNRRCTMWKSGIHWLMQEGIECFVEMVNNSKGIIIITKAKKEQKYVCTEMLFKIIKEIQDTKEDICRIIILKEYLMNSDDPGSFDDEDKLHFISEVKDVLRSGQPSVISVSGRGHLDATKIEHLKHFLLGKFVNFNVCFILCGYTDYCSGQ